MPPLTTEQYLRRIDHALTAMDTGERWRKAEIANIRGSVTYALREFKEGAPDAEIYGKETIDLLRDRVDALAADPEFAGLHEEFKGTIIPT